VRWRQSGGSGGGGGGGGGGGPAFAPAPRLAAPAEALYLRPLGPSSAPTSSSSSASSAATLPALLDAGEIARRRAAPALRDTPLSLSHAHAASSEALPAPPAPPLSLALTLSPPVALAGAVRLGAGAAWFGGCNCALACEAAHKATNPWSDSEKLIFCDRFMQFPKDFGAIAAGLPNKTPADCVAFYYAAKSVAGFKLRLKAQANGLKRSGRQHTLAGWLQACGAARDLGVPVHADTVRGGGLRERAKKVVNAAQRVGDLSYSRLLLHPGPYARVAALHRFLVAPLPLAAPPPAAAPLLQAADLSRQLIAATATATAAAAGAGAGAGGDRAAAERPGAADFGSAGRSSSASASSASASASASPAAVLAAANAHAAAALGASPASLALSGVQPPPASSLAAAVPKDARNEFVFAYGHGHASLPWGSKFGDKVLAAQEDESDGRDNARGLDPLSSTLPPPVSAGAGAR
jgi:hypothetical protein